MKTQIIYIVISTLLYSCSTHQKHPISLNVYKSDLKELKATIDPNDYTVNMTKPSPVICGPIEIGMNNNYYRIYGKDLLFFQFEEMLREINLHGALNHHGHGVLLSSQNEMDLLKLARYILGKYPDTPISFRIHKGNLKKLVHSQEYQNQISHTTFKWNIDEAFEELKQLNRPPVQPEIIHEPPVVDIQIHIDDLHDIYKKIKPKTEP